ncbi:MAG: L-2-hydroxyglutarate oxidase [Acidimicrobiales bacterium]
MTPNKNSTVAERFDVAIVGAGILGLAVARELRRRHPELSMVILERERDVAQHQTGHNSGVIHSGVYYKPGSLKARLCVEGARLMYEFCDEHGIHYERCGKLIVALETKELAGLEELERRGRANEVPGLRRLRAEEIAEVEPGARGIAALHCPQTGIVNYYEVARALADELRDQGVEIRYATHVVSLEHDASGTRVLSEGASLHAGFVIGCAGLWSDRLALAAGASPDPQIVPFRGAYLTLNRSHDPIVRGLVYPVPDPELPFLGVHVTKLINGDVVLGPTAMLVLARDAYRVSTIRWRDLGDILRWPGTWRMGRKFWRTGVDEIVMAARSRRLVAAAANYVPGVSVIGVRAGASSGVRAQAVGRDGALVDDFVFSETPGTLHVRNAPSPAATSSLALAREIVDRVEGSREWFAK